MKSIDVKSLLFGILGTALVMVLMGFTFMTSYNIDCDDGLCYVINTNTGVVKVISLQNQNIVPGYRLGQKPDF